MPKSHQIPCAGIIVFSGTHTILVKKRKSRSLSFPKGKREKDESDINAAWRELFEETGLTAITSN
jgi:8-oxo-dGTP pyrophosphatase MutT (NUDIX family)